MPTLNEVILLLVKLRSIPSLTLESHQESRQRMRTALKPKVIPSSKHSRMVRPTLTVTPLAGTKKHAFFMHNLFWPGHLGCEATGKKSPTSSHTNLTVQNIRKKTVHKANKKFTLLQMQHSSLHIRTTMVVNKRDKSGGKHSGKIKSKQPE